MPHEDSTLTHAKIKGLGYSLRKAEWIARLIVLDMMFIVAVIGILLVLFHTFGKLRGIRP